MCRGGKVTFVRGKANSESEEQTEVSNREWWGLGPLENPDCNPKENVFWLSWADCPPLLTRHSAMALFHVLH